VSSFEGSVKTEDRESNGTVVTLRLREAG